MANKPFEYTIINPLERPTSSDINQLQAQAHYDSRALANQLFAGAEGFLGNSFKAVPTATPSMSFTLSEGVLYTQGSAEDTIGGVAGLSDSYTYKATYLSGRTIETTQKPTAMGYVRWDLIQVKALSEEDRMIDPAIIGKFNPSLKSFTDQSVPKTLTSSLDDADIEIIPHTVVNPTANIVYKNGQEVIFTFGGWPAVPKPDPDAGYKAVAYISRFFEQTEILEDSFFDARTLLTVPSGNIDIVPVSKGGTGNSSTSAATGSVAWFDSGESKFKYTQAVTGAFDTPVSGYLLASNSTGAPTWIAPGTDGQVLVGTGTSWEAQDRFRYYYSLPVTVALGGSVTYSELNDFTLTEKALLRGLVRFRLQPAENGLDSSIRANRPDSVFDGVVYIKIEISGPTPREFVFKTWMGAATDPALRTTVAFPALEDFFEDGNYTIKVYYKTEAATLSFTNCVLIVSQG